jgi:FkbM family methyltransferase
MPLRRLLEVLSRPVTLTRTLPARAGGLRLCVSPAASLAYWRGLDQSAFDDLYDFSARFSAPGAVLWDVGANMGLFSFSALPRIMPGGRVHCFEPDPWARSLLERSMALNPDYAGAIALHDWAITDRSGTAVLCIPQRGRAGSHLEESQEGAGVSITGGVRSRLAVPACTLDSLLETLPPPQLLKIDVDGSEAAALRGARRLLQEHRPVVLVEVFQRNAAEVSALFSSHRYQLYDYTSGEKKCAPIDFPHYQTLALPMR